MARRKEIIGHVGVDGGMLMLGDPCYTVPSDGPVQRETKGVWGDFLRKYIDYDAKEQYWHVGGSREGSMAVVVTTGYGDGVYPVEAEIGDDGRIRSVKVTFIKGRQ